MNFSLSFVYTDRLRSDNQSSQLHAYSFTVIIISSKPKQDNENPLVIYQNIRRRLHSRLWYCILTQVLSKTTRRNEQQAGNDHRRKFVRTFSDRNRNFPIQLLEQTRIELKMHIIFRSFSQSNCSNTVGWYVCPTCFANFNFTTLIFTVIC